MMTRNLTVQLDEETIREAKVLAARKGTSVSGLVARTIQEMTAAAERYEQAKQHALRSMADAADRGGTVGSVTREELRARDTR